MLPLERKSVEPMAASVDPLHASARHQALHHFVAKADWSDEEMLRRIAQWVVSRMVFSGGAFWIVVFALAQHRGLHAVVEISRGARAGRCEFFSGIWFCVQASPRPP